MILKVLGCIESRRVSEVKEGLCMRSYGEVGIHSGLKLSDGAAAWASHAFLKVSPTHVLYGSSINALVHEAELQ